MTDNSLTDRDAILLDTLPTSGGAIALARYRQSALSRHLQHVRLTRHSLISDRRTAVEEDEL